MTMGLAGNCVCCARAPWCSPASLAVASVLPLTFRGAAIVVSAWWLPSGGSAGPGRSWEGYGEGVHDNRFAATAGASKRSCFAQDRSVAWSLRSTISYPVQRKTFPINIIATSQQQTPLYAWSFSLLYTSAPLFVQYAIYEWFTCCYSFYFLLGYLHPYDWCYYFYSWGRQLFTLMKKIR
jgi:hypothetical protein